MLNPCSPPGSPQPSMRSSTSFRSRPGTLFRTVSTMNAAMSSARSSVNEPLKARPMGVRAVATMTASGTTDSSGGSGARESYGIAAARTNRRVGEPLRRRSRAGVSVPAGARTPPRVRGLRGVSVQAPEPVAVAGAVLDVLAGTDADHDLGLHRVEPQLGRHAECHRPTRDLHVV